jgi:hypothetical protein
MMSDENNFENEFDDLDMDLDEDLMDDLDSGDGDDWEEDFEDWDDNADSVETATQGKPAKTKKKGGLGKVLFILILLGGAGGALYFTVLGGGKTPGGNDQGLSPQNIAANQAANEQMNIQGTDMAAMSAPAMPDVNSAPMDMGDMPPMPTAMVMDDDAVPANDGDVDSIEFPKMDMGGASTGGLTPMPDFSAPAPDVMAVPDMPEIAAMQAPTPSMPAPVVPTMAVPEMPVIEAPVAAPVMAMPDFDGSAPISAPDMMAMKVEAPVSTAPRVPEFGAPVESNDVPSQKVLNELDKVSEQMDDIVTRLDRLESDLSKVRSGGGDVSQLSAELRSIKQQLKSSANQGSARAATTRAAPVMPSASHKVKPAYKAPTPTEKWVLKGIAQNEAWIAHAGSTDIQKVTVGDRVKGLGRINSIGLENGVWLVRGTQGSVKQ